MRQALEMALEALELMYACYKNPKWVSYKQQEQKILEQTVDTITAIKEALAQPEREPDGYVQTVIDALYENSDPVSVEAAELLERMTQPEHEPVAFYVYKPTLPRGHLGNVSDGDLPWVYDQDSSSGYSARMLVYTTSPQTKKPEQEPVAWVNWCAATGKRSVSFECESELASQPLYTKEQS